jgi:CMP-N-acetylneuraminic acid synthetase
VPFVLPRPSAPLLKTKAEIARARELFVSLNAASLWSQAEAKRRRFSKADLDIMEQEHAELEKFEERDRARERARRR